MSRFLLPVVAALSLVALSSCDPANPSKVEPELVQSRAGEALTVIEDGDTTFTVTAVKWLHGAKAAVSIT